MRAVYKIFLSVLIIAVALFSCSCGGESSELQETTATQVILSTKATEAQTTEPMTVQETTKKTEHATESATEKDVSNAEKGEKTVALNNEYITRYQEVNQVTYPPFVFNYPDNWSVTKEECNQQEELVTLENDGGASVTFLHYSGELQGGGSGVYMNKEEISKVASSQFVPGFVQATDHSSLGEFMVARIKTIGKLNMKTDREYIEVDGNVAYAVLPVSEEGIREGVKRAISGEYTFWYSSTISFTASNSEEFTPQEEKEVIAILSSFRIA